MKGIKILGLAALTALALTAFSGVASASGPSFFTAGSYPATLKGEATGAQGSLTTFYTSKCTSPALTGTLSKPSESLTTTAKYNFGNCSIYSMNGCEFIFHPPAEGINGTFDIGGSECKGILGEQVYKFVIPAQTGLAATFKNEGTGASAKIEIHAQVTGLKYELTNGPKESYSNGSYTTTWSVSGEHAGSSTGVSIHPYPGFSVASNEEGPEFHSELYPATIGGEQSEGTVEGKTIKKIELVTAPGAVKCSKATFSSSGWAPGGLIADTEALVLSPSLAECTLTGIGVTVTPTAGCLYTFLLTGSSPYVGSLFLCETKISAGGNCTITVPGQTRSGMEYVNVGSGSSETVEAKANLSGLEYQITGNCPNQPAEGLHTDGKYKGVVKLNVTKVN